MNIQVLEIENKNNELFFNIVDKDTNLTLGIVFTIANHIVYEIKSEYRSYGIATETLKIITSKKVAQKAGYVLVNDEPPFEIYKYSKENAIATASEKCRI